MDLFETEQPQPIGPDCFVRVVVERGIEGEVGREGLTYRGDNLDIGQWVRVPLGRGGKPVGGVVVAKGGRELLDDLDPRRVKAVLEAGRPALSPQLVELARWIAWYYVCPLGLVVKAMLPIAVKHAAGARTRTLVRPASALPPHFDPDSLTPSAARAWDAIQSLDAKLFPIDARALAREVHAANVGPINRLLQAGLLETTERREVRSADERWMTESREPLPPPTPTQLQQDIIDAIALDLGRPAVHLVRGVTGSGKTEIYLRLIARALEQNMGAIVLVPEIALTPQTVRRFADRFGKDTLAVLHSQLTPTQRNRAWSACAEGVARILIGPRSAILAPMPRLGLIVVDEEHDQSYKQDQAPRYGARDVAIKRAHIEHAAVVLGSATPSLESWRNAREGRYRLWTLHDRVGGGKLPPVRIIDLAEERRSRFRDGAANRQGGTPSAAHSLDLLGPSIESALRETLDRGSQAILLLNRRGLAGYVGCANNNCGWAMHCDACDALMTAHRMPRSDSKRYLRCHHCEAAQRIPDRCPSCTGPMVLLNAGTQHVETELAERLGLEPGKDFERVDSDSMRSGRAYFDVLDRFGAGKLRVLLGTQMIAKGLDFPAVGLVGVLNADTALMLPDFRAGERTFQLVSQVAGRAGRGDEATHGPALVLVQTMNPTDPAITLAAEHDYESFAAAELAARAAASLPPSTRMARIAIRHESFETAKELANDAARELRRQSKPGVRVEGPEPCTLARIANRYRFEVRVLSPKAGPLIHTLDAVRHAEALTSDATHAIDVDPMSVL